VSDIRDLLVGVLVARNDAALFELEASEHGLGAGNELAGQHGIELFYGNVRPTGMEGFSGHHKRVPRVRPKDIRGGADVL
jgi:hypothetical protein